MNATETFLQSLQQKSGARVGTMLTIDPRNPDDAVENMRVGAELGLPANVVGADPAAFKRQLAQKNNTTALTNAPKTAAWLADLNNGVLAKDDIDNLTWFEKSIAGAYTDMGERAADTVPGRMAQRGGLRIAANVPQFKASAAAQVLADRGKTFDQIYEEVAGKYGSDAPASILTTAQQVAQLRFDNAQSADMTATATGGANALAEARGIMAQIEALPLSDTSTAFRDGPLKNTPDTLGGLAEAIWADPVGGAAFLAETAGEFLPALAASAATTAVTRSPAAGALVLGSGSFLSENAASAQAFLSEKGVDMSTPEAAMEVLNNADLMREAGERGATRGVIIGALDALSGGVAGQALVKNPGADILVQTLAQMALGGGGEALATAAVGDEVNWKEVGLEALGEALTLPADIVIGGRTLRDMATSAQSGTTAATIDEIDQMAAASKLKARSPEKFQEALDAQGESDFYVSAEDLREYFQAKDVAIDDETLSAWGIEPTAFAEAESAGGDVTVSRSTYAARISGTDDAAWFRENAITEPGEMSVAQATRFNSEVRTVMEKALADAEDQRASDLEARASDVQVYDNVFSHLREAGRTRDVADSEARVWSSFWRTMGERYGADPLDLARSMGVDIRGPQTPEASRRRNDLDVKLNTLRSNPTKALKPAGSDLLDFIRSQGGVSDTGGDIAAMDAPKGIIGETREEFEARRGQGNLLGATSAKAKGLDELGRAAIEAGYFPELMGGADIQMDGTVVDEAAVLLEALQRAISGETIYAAGEGPDPDMTALSEQLSQMGLDLREMSNDEIVAALDGGGQTYNQEGSTKRGSIVLPSGGLESGQTVINLFESANLSTVIHESGHFFLEAFTALATSADAPQAMRDDLATIHKFLGVEDGAAFTTEQHEKWARGFEAYAMEGKAPSLELADAFGRFKSWLTRIYKTALGLNVKITPEIREVMDRMLATDAEIADAREMQQMSALFTDQAASGMSDAAWSTYQRMARRSEDQASQALLEKTMAKVRREKEQWFKDERKQVREEVTATINSRREYRLIEMLANQKWLGSEQEVPDFQLDRAELVEAFGEGILPELARTRFGGKRAIYGADGSSLREVADFFGFANPSEMVETLQNTGKRQAAIELETDRIMSDRYGDPLNDGSIEEEALAAIHSEQQAQTLATEVRHLAGQAGKPTRNLTAKVFRQRARLMLGRMSVKDATRPDAFLAAERKAAKGAEDAFARVGAGRNAGPALATAAKHKDQQLLNHYLYLESRDLTKMVAAKREKMRNYNKKSVREKLDGGYIEQIDALLDGYDFRVRSMGQVQRSENLRQFVERMTEEGRAGELAIDARLMDEAFRKHYTRLSVDELRGLFDTIDNIDHMGRFKKKLQDAKDARDMDEVVSGILGEFSANVSGNPPNRTPTAGEARRKLGRDYLNTVLNADTLLREVDGFKDLGPTWTAMKARVDSGMNRLTERRVEMAKSFDAIYGAYTAKEKRDMAVKRQNDTLGGLFSKWDLISLALNTGNNDNFQRLTNPKVKGSFRQSDIEAALAALDDRDWQTVQNIWDYIDSFWPEIAAKEKRQTGLAPSKVEAKQIVSAPGFVRGGYYPLRYDSRLSGLASDFKQKDLAQEIMGGMFGKAQTKNGHTKERGKTATQPVTLDLGVAHAHVDQVLYDLEIGEAVNNSWKILHDGRIREAFTEKGKQSDFDALEIWLQDVAAGERVAAGGLQSLMRHVRSGFTISRLALNVSTALIQPTGLVQSAVLIGKRAVAQGTVDYMSNMSRWVNDATTVSSLMRERKKTFERDIYNVVGDLESGPVTGRYAKFQRDVIMPLSFWMMQTTQFYAVDMPTWVSAYQKEVKASGNEQKARDYADLMVKRAQGSGLMSDRGMLERGTLNAQSRQQEFPRMLTALGSYMFAKGNVFYEKARQTDFKNPAQVMALAADVALLFTLEAVLYSAVKGYLPGEDDDEPLEVAGWLGGQTLSSMASTLPLMRELSGAVQGFNGGGIFGSAVEVLAKPMVQAAQGEADKALVKSFLDAGGVMLHLPASQSKAVLDAAFETDMSFKSEIDPLAALGLGGGKGRSLADIMFGD